MPVFESHSRKLGLQFEQWVEIFCKGASNLIFIHLVFMRYYLTNSYNIIVQILKNYDDPSDFFSSHCMYVICLPHSLLTFSKLSTEEIVSNILNLSQVLYVSSFFSSFWLLGDESRDFSYAEKELFAKISEFTKWKLFSLKIVLGCRFEWRWLSFCEFAQICTEFFLRNSTPHSQKLKDM